MNRPQKPIRKTILDQAVANLLSDMEEKQQLAQLPRRERKKKVKEHHKITARKEQRVTYDLPPALRQRIKQLSEDEGVPASQVVTLALMNFVERYDEKQIDLSIYKQPSRSPRYDWNLIFDDRKKGK